MSANLVLHWHLDALTPESRAVDTTDNHINGRVEGNPQNLPDERFGSCLAFDGVADGLIVDPTPALQLTTYTAEVWVQAKQPGGEGRATLLATSSGPVVVLDADGTVFHGFGTSANAADGFASTPGFLGWDSWQHLAVTNDGSTARTYVNGTLVTEYAVTAALAPADGSLVVGRDRSGGGHVAGRLAHLRIYDGALADVEIARDMAEDESALAAFVRTHPLDFDLSNQDEHHVLYIDDNPSGQPMTLTVTNSSRQDMVFEPIPGGRADEKAWHLALQFRADTLAASPTPQISTAGWTLSRSLDGDTLYLLRADPGPLRAGDSMVLSLNGMNADGRDGTRGSRVEMQYQKLQYSGEELELTGSRLQYLDVVNHRGRREIPLHVGFSGGDRVLSDGRTPNTLTLRIANVSRDFPLPLQSPDGNAAFIVHVDVQAAHESREWALLDAGDVPAVDLSVSGSGSWDPPVKEALGERVSWTLRPQPGTVLTPDGYVEFQIDHLVALRSIGTASVYLNYVNIPGYEDGFFSVTVEKSPLLFSDQNVGIGTARASDLLQLSDFNESGEHYLKVVGASGTAGAAVNGLRLRHGNDVTGFTLESNDAASPPGLTVWRHDNSSDAVPALFVSRGDGSVGVGTTTPEGRLQLVHQNQDPNGNTLILGPTGQSNLRLGYSADYSWIQSHGSKPLALNLIGNNVGIGTANPPAKLTVSADSSHLQLRREPGATAGKQLYLELYQNDGAAGTVYPSIRFHHSNIFWQRVEAREDGFYLKPGDLNSDALVNLHAGTGVFNNLQIGSITIGENELRILQRLTAGALEFDLYNTYQGEYAYAADYAPFDDDRRRVFTWRHRDQRVNQGRWRITWPA